MGVEDIPTPEGVRAQWAKTLEPAVAQLREKVTAAFAKHPTSPGALGSAIWVELSGTPTAAVNIVQEELGHKGWAARLDDSQRGGSWLVIQPAGQESL